MMKKGVMLDTTTGFIIGIVFLVLLIFGIIATGLLSVFIEQTSLLLCTFSVYSRGAIMQLVETLLPFIVTIITIIMLLGAGSAKIGGSMIIGIIASQVSGISILEGIKEVGATISMASLVVTFLVFMSTSNIPLFCNINTVTLEEEPVSEFISSIGSRTIDTYNTFGGGTLNPLWGLKANPRALFVFYTKLDEETNMSYVAYESSKAFEQSWPLGNPDEGDMKLHLYCPDYKGNNPNSDAWRNCKIEDSTIYVMYFDKVPWDEISPYGSELCNMKMGIEYAFRTDFTLEEDVVVWCVK